MSTPVTPIQEKKFSGVRVTTCELDFISACDILPTVIAMGAPMAGLMNRESDESVIEAVLSRLSIALAGANLRELLPKLLAATTVYVPTGDRGSLERVDLINEDQINKAFTGRKRLGVDVVRWALEVNFKDFLDVRALIGFVTKKANSSPSSSPSTSGVTSDTGSSNADEQPTPS